MNLKQCRSFIATTVLVTGVSGLGLAHLSSEEPWGSGKANAIVDQYQRSYEVLHHNEVAKNGPERGLTIYFHKCWTCHTETARAGDESGLVGPALNDVARRMTDAALATKIKNGGPRMPAFGTNFTDADVADVV